ncbi:MAG: hypothetical protein F6K36_30125 [Symploca sp. SIO3C6]|nr:hypothetical protein [Symploca sp. SIO3C6]
MPDALDRLKKRNRPKVPPRDTSLSSNLDIQTSRHIDKESPQSEDIQISSTSSPDLTETSKSRHTDVKASTLLEDELQTRRSTFRLDATLIDRLHSFCRTQGLSREVLIEAMFEYMEDHPDALSQVVVEAGNKHEYRQRIANRKRAEAMMQKFGGAS